MAWNVQIAARAERDFLKLPAKERARVEAALRSMGEDPFQGDIKRLAGQSISWRRRVGSYRILYDLHFEQRLIEVTAIVRRTSTTY